MEPLFETRTALDVVEEASKQKAPEVPAWAYFTWMTHGDNYDIVWNAPRDKPLERSQKYLHLQLLDCLLTIELKSEMLRCLDLIIDGHFHAECDRNQPFSDLSPITVRKSIIQSQIHPQAAQMWSIAYTFGLSKAFKKYLAQQHNIKTDSLTKYVRAALREDGQDSAQNARMVDKASRMYRMLNIYFGPEILLVLWSISDLAKLVEAIDLMEMKATLDHLKKARPDVLESWRPLRHWMRALLNGSQRIAVVKFAEVLRTQWQDIEHFEFCDLPNIDPS